MRLMTCTIRGCRKPIWARWLCGMHYQRMARKGTTDDRAFLGTWRTTDNPTPHDEITNAGWFRDMQPMPAPDAHIAAQRRYAAQNERDGYTTDAEYLRCVALWHQSELAQAAD